MVRIQIFIMQSKKSKIKVAFIISHTNHSLQWEWFLDELNKYVDIFFIILTHENDLNKITLYNNLKIAHYQVKLIKVSNFFSYLYTITALVFFLLKNKIDIVQTEMPHGNLLGLFAAFICGRKRVMTASNVTWFKDFNSKKQYLIDKFSYTIAHKIICQTQTSADIIIKEFNLPKNKIKVIHHAIKPDEYLNVSHEEVQRLKEKYNIRKDDFVLGMIARLEHWKGHLYAIKAMKNVVEEYPFAKLLIFGEGPEKQKLQELINQLNLNQKVFLCGFEKNILPLYLLFDIQIHVPIDPFCETFGITIIDGMMMKRPFILTRSGIAHDIAQHQYNAWLVNFKDDKSIANAVKYLIEHPELRIKLGENAQKTVLTYFSLSEKVNRHLELYQQLLIS